MKSTHTVALTLIMLFSFALHAEGAVTTTTVRPDLQGVIDAKSAVKYPKYLNECNFAVGDSLEKVQQFYGINSEPHQNKYSNSYSSKYLKSHKLRTAYTYHFDQYGVWVFFDQEKKVKSLRFNHPFTGTVGGIKIGDSPAQILKLNGEPDVKNEKKGLLDTDVLHDRNMEIQKIVNSIPDPAPKELVIQKIEKIREIDQKPLHRTTVWIYKATDSLDYFNYSISPTDQQVRYMFSGTCNPQVRR